MDFLFLNRLNFVNIAGAVILPNIPPISFNEYPAIINLTAFFSSSFNLLNNFCNIINSCNYVITKWS